MATQSKTRAVNVKEELLKARGENKPIAQEEFYFTASTTDPIELIAGWKPKYVFRAGSKKREGSGEDFTITYDGHIYSVVPTATWGTDDVDIIAERVQ